MEIILRQCTVDIEIGIHDFEQGRKQRLFVDVTVETFYDDDQDDIANTLDYDRIRNHILKLAEEKFNLQETVCLRILDFIGSFSNVIAASVFTRKPDVYPETDEVGVRMMRRY